MMMETTYQVARPAMSAAIAEEWQRRREAMWEVAVGAEAAKRLAVHMRNRSPSAIAA